MTAVQDAQLDTLLQATSTNVLAWFETRNLVPSEDEATRFLNLQSWMSAVRLVGAADPLIHVCVNLVRDLIPEDADALSELLHVQLARVCASGWVGSRATHEEDVAVGITAELRAWLIERQRSGQLSADIAIRPLDPTSTTSSSIHLQTDAISYIVMAGVDRHLTESRAQTYLLKLDRIRSTLGITAAELGRLLRVSREAIRKWERGDPIAADRWPDIDRLLEAVQMLLRYFKPEYLPSVVRRPIPDLNNDTPIDYLASRRFDELAAYFDEKFSFGTTT
jgi:DNA-binding transcriptional regulator YiaG